ncbi:MAG: PrsW family glutamic-type intramembrane protease [Verrucomicrobiota bacterium]
MVEAVFIGTFVPMVLMLVLLRHSRPVIGCFCWGMAAFLLTHLLSPSLTTLLGTNEFGISAVFIGPALEEFLKPIPILLLAFIAVRSLVPFFYILGLAAGIGFAVEENVIYLIRFGLELEEGSRVLMVLRSFSTCLMHGVATGLTGFFVTEACRQPKSWSWMLVVMAWLVALAYHGLFNWLMLEGHLAIGVLVAMAVFTAFLIAMKECEKRAPETRGTMWE